MRGVMRIVGLRLELKPEKDAEPFLDLTAELDGNRRTLRFFSPQSIEIEEGGPVSGGLKILDVSHRQLEDLRVRVDDYEGSGVLALLGARCSGHLKRRYSAV